MRAADGAAKAGAERGSRQGFGLPHGLVRGFEHADKAGRGCRSKLAWVLLGQHQFGRGWREVHCTWGQTGVCELCGDVAQRARGV